MVKTLYQEDQRKVVDDPDKKKKKDLFDGSRVETQKELKRMRKSKKK